MTTASAKAADLARKLVALTNEFKAFQSEVMAVAAQAADDSRYEAAQQIDSVACTLARLHGDCSGPGAEYDLFIDWARDDKVYDFTI